MDVPGWLALLKSGGPWAFVVGVILVGCRYVIGTVERVLNGRAEAAERREAEWRKVAETEQKRGQVQDDHIGDLLEMSRTTAAIWQAIQQQARLSRGGDG